LYFVLPSFIRVLEFEPPQAQNCGGSFFAIYPIVYAFSAHFVALRIATGRRPRASSDSRKALRIKRSWTCRFAKACLISSGVEVILISSPMNPLPH
jgi:hypothetical protein